MNTITVYEAQAEAGAVVIYSRETIAKGDRITSRWGWHEVTRVNPKTVTIALDWHETFRPYGVAYGDISGHITAADYAARVVAAGDPGQ